MKQLKPGQLCTIYKRVYRCSKSFKLCNDCTVLFKCPKACRRCHIYANVNKKPFLCLGQERCSERFGKNSYPVLVK